MTTDGWVRGMQASVYIDVGGRLWCQIQDEVMNSVGTTVDVSQLTSSSLSCSILNAVGVVSFNVASMLCERITEELLNGLTSCFQSLVSFTRLTVLVSRHLHTVFSVSWSTATVFGLVFILDEFRLNCWSKKVKTSHTLCRALGPELIPLILCYLYCLVKIYSGVLLYSVYFCQFYQNCSSYSWDIKKTISDQMNEWVRQWTARIHNAFTGTFGWWSHKKTKLLVVVSFMSILRCTAKGSICHGRASVAYDVVVFMSSPCDNVGQGVVFWAVQFVHLSGQISLDDISWTPGIIWIKLNIHKPLLMIWLAAGGPRSRSRQAIVVLNASISMQGCQNISSLPIMLQQLVVKKEQKDERCCWCWWILVYQQDPAGPRRTQLGYMTYKYKIQPASST